LSFDRTESLLVLAAHFCGRLRWLIQQADSAGRKAASQTNESNTPPIKVSMMEATSHRDFFLKSEPFEAGKCKDTQAPDAETCDSIVIHRMAGDIRP
jgi:hypothetical protein